MAIAELELLAYRPGPYGAAFRAAVSEGFCPYGHGPMKPVRLHDENTSACLECECSWRIAAGVLWGVACVPGGHTCGEPG